MKPSLAKKELDAAEFDAMSALDSIRRDWKNFAPSDAVVPALAEIVRTAGDLALGFFRPGAKTSAAISKKAGGSPVTEADHAVNRYLEDKLRALLPEAGWLSEESPDNDERINQDLVFIGRIGVPRSRSSSRSVRLPLSSLMEHRACSR